MVSVVDGDSVLLFNYCGIKNLTEEQLSSEQFQKAKCLYLKRNLLRSLPSGVKQLIGLVQLHIAENELESVPTEIGSLSALEVLDVVGNNLMSLPATIGQLRSLRKLQVSNNQLQHIPTEIGQLKYLHTLEMSRNQLTTLPIELSRCSGLSLLALDRNRLRSFPRQLCRLKNLSELSVCGNYLEYLPQGIRRMDRLCSVIVDDNPALWSFPYLFDITKCNFVGYQGCFQKDVPLNERFLHIFIKDSHVTIPEEIQEMCIPFKNCVPCLKELAMRKLSSSLGDNEELKQNLLLPKDLKDSLLDPTDQCSSCGCDLFSSAFPKVLQHSFHWKRDENYQTLMLELCCSSHCVFGHMSTHLVYPFERKNLHML